MALTVALLWILAAALVGQEPRAHTGKKTCSETGTSEHLKEPQALVLS